MIRDDVDTTERYFTERVVEAFGSLSGRDYALGGTLAVILLFVVMTGAGFLMPPSLEVGAIKHHAHSYYADVQDGEDQRCETRYGQKAAAREDVGLAFPGTDLTTASSRALTVTYRRGPPDRPEGSLLSQEGITARRGEVFNVSATTKS